MSHDIMCVELKAGYLSTWLRTKTISTYSKNVVGVYQVIDVLYNVCDQSRSSTNSSY